MGKILGLVLPCVHALGYLDTDFNGHHAAIDFDGDLHRVVLLFRFRGVTESEQERVGSGTGAGVIGLEIRNAWTAQGHSGAEYNITSR